MKNKEIFWGTFLLIFTFVLFFLANNHDKKQVQAKEPEDSIPVIADSSYQYYDTERIIIIGDSRMYNASKVVKDDGIIFIAKNGATCNYLWETAEKKVDEILEENPDEHFTIFINLGVNDVIRIARGIEDDGKKICNASQYSEYYIKLKEKWNDHNLFFESVNPFDEEFAKKRNKNYSSNETINQFNLDLLSKIEEKGIYYCDTYQTLMEDGFDTKDSLHFTDSTSKKIIKDVRKCDLYRKDQKSSYISPIISQLRAIHVDTILKRFGGKLQVFNYYI